MLSLLRLRKKGMATQVDWAISLGIFLVFTFWFFILLKQMSAPELRMENTVEEIESRFKESVMFQYYQIPIYVSAEEDISYAPILARNPTNWTNYVLDENIFSARDDEFLYFMVNLSEGDNLFIMKSSEMLYDVAPPSEYITKSSETVSVPSENYSVRYANGILSEVYLDGVQQLNDFKTYMDDQRVYIDNTSESTPGYLVKHNMSSDLFNLRSYIFPENSYMINFLDIYDTVASNVTFNLEFTLPMYDEYYLDPVVPYTLDLSDGCIVEENHLIDLVDEDNKSIMFSFDSDVQFEMCDVSTIHEEDRMSLTVDIPYSPSDQSSSTRFIINSHDSNTAGELTDVVSPSDVHVGIRESFDGFSKSRLTDLRSMSYIELLELWDIPRDTDFSIDVYDEEGEQLFFFRTSESGQSDVFSRTFRDFMVDERGEKEFIYVNINIW
ncbi:MAG: hypothetical protein ACLFSL_00035 [Candidatus Woesearchaeota archaeon]